MFFNKLFIGLFCGLILQLVVVNCFKTHLLLYTPSNVEEAFEIENNNLEDSPFLKDSQTIFIIHGFDASGYESWIQETKNEFLQQDSQNVIVVNWRMGALPPNYFGAKANIFKVATQLKEFIIESKINPNSIYCIGHSLGAHACGIAAQGLVFRRISGLDPAGPCFKNDDDIQNRLNKHNADIVDIINTDSCFGINKSIGRFNFYPNGGEIQPGCDSSYEVCELFDQLEHAKGFPKFPSKFEYCSHVRAHQYYLSSLKSKCFKARRCDSFDSYKNGSCNDLEEAYMGFDAAETIAEGDYYLTTSAEAPFCLNQK